MVGYSGLIERDEVGTVERLKSDREALIDPTIKRHGGDIVRLAGDGALVEFSSVVNAVQCAIDIQRGLAQRNALRPQTQRSVFRIGVNLGDVIVEDDNLHGEGINIAARLESLAEPGGILLSEQVAQNVEGKIDATLAYQGERTVKNIVRPVRIWEVLLDTDGAATAAPPSRPRKRLIAWLAFAAMLVVAGIAATLIWLQPWVPAGNQPDTGSATAESQPSIAVLPFDNLSDDPQQEYFADGIADDIITDLSTLGGLSVIARNSSFVYKDRTMDVRQIGTELGVTYILEGSVRKIADRVRINAQLIDASNGTHMWAERFDEQLVDIFAVQDRVIRRIVAALSLTLTPDEEKHLGQAATSNPEAYEQYLLGRNLFPQFTVDRYKEARAHFRRAIELDPRFARAYSALAATYANEVLQGVAEDRERSLQQALDLARTALAIDPALPQGQLVLGYTYLFQRQHQRAIEAERKAIELSPSYADAYVLLALIYVHEDRVEEAFPLIDKGMRLNPNYSAEFLVVLAYAHYWSGNIEASISALMEVLRRNPVYIAALVYYIAALGRANRLEEASWQVEELLLLAPNFTVDQWVADRPFSNARQSEQLAQDLKKAGLS